MKDRISTVFDPQMFMQLEPVHNEVGGLKVEGYISKVFYACTWAIVSGSEGGLVDVVSIHVHVSYTCVRAV